MGFDVFLCRMKKKYNIKNLDCANCAAALEKHIQKIEEINSATINFSAGTLVIDAQDAGYEQTFAKVLRIVHEIEPDVIIEEPNAKAQKKFPTKKVITYSLLAVGVAVGGVALWTKLPIWAFWTLLVASALLIGWQTYYKACVLLVKGTINENLLVTISVVGAIALGEHMEGLMVVLLYTIGKILEGAAVERSKHSISALMELQPEYANLIEENGTHKVEPKSVEVGSHILVKLGERVPLDGICVSEGGFVDARHLTGESAPVRINKGDEVKSGSIVLDGIFEIETTKVYADSTVSQIMNLLESASEKKSKTETFIAKFSKWYTLIVVVAAFITFGIAFAVLGDVKTAVYRGLTFLVISCPCAFAISVPLAYFSGIGNASKKGILIKGSNYLDICANLNTIVFDKTGTLTKGHFGIEKIECFNKNYTSEQILKIAASGEQFSIHPIARAIMHAAKGTELFEVKNFKEIAGKGISYEIEGKKYEIVGDDAVLGASVAVFCDNKKIGKIALVDQIKPASYIAISALKKKKIKTIILSGDNTTITTAVASELGVDEFHADLEPKDKFAWLEKLTGLKDKHKRVGFVGDGINDAPSLRLADVGISMGLEGSPATVEASDVVLVDDNPEKLVSLIDLSFNTRKIVIENIAFAFTVKIAFLLLSAFGISGMLWAVFADVGVTLLAVLNSMRALFYHLPKNATAAINASGHEECCECCNHNNSHSHSNCGEHNCNCSDHKECACSEEHHH